MYIRLHSLRLASQFYFDSSLTPPVGVYAVCCTSIASHRDQMATSQFTDAGGPFDNPNADVVLRSADNVDFRTFKLILSLPSPIFDDMFGMIQPSSESSINEMKDGAPVVSVSESTVTLKRLLEFCHPNCVPVLDNLEVISGILAAAE